MKFVILKLQKEEDIQIHALKKIIIKQQQIAAGMKVGVYHYWRGTSSAIEQAQNVVITL